LQLSPGTAAVAGLMTAAASSGAAGVPSGKQASSKSKKHKSKAAKAATALVLDEAQRPANGVHASDGRAAASAAAAAPLDGPLSSQEGALSSGEQQQQQQQQQQQEQQQQQQGQQGQQEEQPAQPARLQGQGSGQTPNHSEQESASAQRLERENSSLGLSSDVSRSFVDETGAVVIGRLRVGPGVLGYGSAGEALAQGLGGEGVLCLPLPARQQRHAACCKPGDGSSQPH
jgi:hypothetical protein